MSRASSRAIASKLKSPETKSETEIEIVEDEHPEVPGEELEDEDNELDEEDDEEESDKEDEYEVEAIVAHKLERGKYKYLVAWKGYGPEHNTWEPQENVSHAEKIVKDYWAKQPKDQIDNIKKRGRLSSGSIAPRENSRPAKASRTSKDRNGTSSAAVKEGQENMGMDYESTHIDSLSSYEDVAEWEDLVKQIDTVERGADGTLMVYLQMTRGERAAIPSEIANKRCPQRLLKFYESHLKWRMA